MRNTTAHQLASEPRVLCIDPVRNATHTYEQLLASASELTQRPHAVCTTNIWELSVSLLACILNGNDLLVCNQTPSTTADHEHQVNREKPWNSLKNANVSSLAEVIDACPSRIGIQTSGSTGEPKIVWHELASLTRAVRRSPQHRHAVWGVAYHPCHFAGLQVLFQALLNENPVVGLFGLSLEQAHIAIEQHSITHLSGTPTYFNLLCSSGTSVHPNVQRITSGGERLSPAIIERMRRVFPNARLNNIYASTEAGSLLAGDGESFRIPPAQMEQIKVIDGELAIHRSLLAESLNQSQDTAASGPRWQGDYWLSGDLVEWLPPDSSAIDGNGINHTSKSISSTREQRFRIVGRRSETINVGGYNVNPLEVEARLLELPEVHEVRVYGKNNSVTGQIVVCDIVFAAGQALTVKDVRDRLGGVLAPYKLPRIIQPVTELPQTSSGKRARR